MIDLRKRFEFLLCKRSYFVFLFLQPLIIQATIIFSLYEIRLSFIRYLLSSSSLTIRYHYTTFLILPLQINKIASEEKFINLLSRTLFKFVSIKFQLQYFSLRWNDSRVQCLNFSTTQNTPKTKQKTFCNSIFFTLPKVVKQSSSSEL